MPNYFIKIHLTAVSQVFSEPLCKHSGVKRPWGRKIFTEKLTSPAKLRPPCRRLKRNADPASRESFPFSPSVRFSRIQGLTVVAPRYPSYVRPWLQRENWISCRTPSPQPHAFFLFFLFSECGLKAGGGSSRTFCRDCPSFLFYAFFSVLHQPSTLFSSRFVLTGKSLPWGIPISSLYRTYIRLQFFSLIIVQVWSRHGYLLNLQ